MAMLLSLPDIQHLKEFAESHVISHEECLRIYNKEAKCVGDREGYSIDIPIKYRLVYSIEWTPDKDMKKIYKCRRMSISVKNNVDEEQRWVNEIALERILSLLGFESLSSGKSMIAINRNDIIPNICVTEVLETKRL